MKKYLLTLLLLSTASLLVAHSPSEEEVGPAQAKAWEKNNVQAWLKVDIDKETREVKFTRRNNDPEIYTKVYLLQHANPYEIRPYIRSAVQDATRSGFKTAKGQNRCRVECIQYSDGVHALIVSAEDYRFERTNLGMSMDELVKLLDIPGIESSSGQKFYCYFPKYWSAKELNDRIKEVGILTNSDNDGTNNPTELIAGNEKTGVDAELNALLLYINPGHIRIMSQLLEQYDRPIPEVSVKYTVYEIDLENDAKLGADFQSWRNGDGSRAFSFASRMRDGWNYNGSGIATNPNARGSGVVSNIGLSPKWNTKYLDFLKSQGAAKTVTSGSVALRNDQTASVSASNSIIYTKDGEKLNDEVVESLVEVQKSFVTAKDPVYNITNTDDVTMKEGRYMLDIKDLDGNGVKVVKGDGSTLSVWNATTKKDNAQSGIITITKNSYNGTTRYALVVTSGDLAFKLDDGTLVRSFDQAQSVKAYSSYVNASNISGRESIEFKEASLSYTAGLTIYRDVQRKTTSTAEQFMLNLRASVSQKATVLQVGLQNNGTIVGFGDVGDPRVNKSSFSTQVHVPNTGAQFMIGGIEKVTSEKSVAKVPYLGDIPVLGWLLSTESTATRRYQMVTVLEVTTSLPDAAVSLEMNKEIARISEAIIKPGEENYNYGFDQFGLDKEKVSLDPLP